MRILATIGLILLLAFAAACGGAGSTTQTPVPPTPTPTPPDPLAIYQAMAAGMGSANSLHASFTFEGEEGSVSGEIDVQFPDQLQVSLTFSEEGGEPSSFESIAVGGEVFVRFLNFQGWFSVPAGEDDLSDITDILNFFTAVGTGVSGLTYLGQEAIGDVPAFHLRGIASKELVELVGEEEEVEEDASGTVDLWISADDSLLLRLRLEETSPGSDVSEFTFSAFNAPVTIEAPANVVSFDVFEALATGNIGPQLLGDLISILSVEGQGCLRDALGENTYNSLGSGTGSLGPEEGLAFQQCMAGLLGGGEEARGEETSELVPEEVLSFFAGLPDEVKAQLEAAGWTHERISALAEGGGEDVQIEEARSLFTILPNVSIPFLSAQATRVLNRFPSFMLAPLIEQIGQQAIDELKAGSRPPTGAEFLAILELISSIGF